MKKAASGLLFSQRDAEPKHAPSLTLIEDDNCTSYAGHYCGSGWDGSWIFPFGKTASLIIFLDSSARECYNNVRMFGALRCVKELFL